MLEPHPLLRVEKIYEDLNFEVPKGRILGLLGKNGTGKTTTINILMGYLKPRSGECRIFGEDIQRMQPVTRERIALLIENHVQYTFMNIEQIERFYSAFYPKWNKEAYYELMRKLKVAPKQKSPACHADKDRRWHWASFSPKTPIC